LVPAIVSHEIERAAAVHDYEFIFL
jgi:hypothetical protein